MGCQTPPLSNRTAPMPVPGLLPIADLKPHPPDDASQSHDALSPMANCSVAEGEKLRLGGQLPAGAFAPSVGASTPAPQPKLPVQSPTMSVRYYFPKSSVSFLRPDDFDWMRNQWSVSLDEEPITTLLLWGQCQDAHGASLLIPILILLLIPILLQLSGVGVGGHECDKKILKI